MNQSFKSIFVLPLLVLLIGIGVYFNGSEPSLHDSKQCELDDTLICRFNLVKDSDQDVSVEFLENVQIEEQNEMILTLPPDVLLQDIWIQGVNMFMGKVAVFELPTTDSRGDNQRHLQFFLGSCSEAKMRWQLVMVIKKASMQQSETYFINFKTDISSF